MAKEEAPLVLNGSHGEGGGALFRTALAVAALTLQSVRIHSIRGATRRPGLNSEDLTFLRALEMSCSAQLSGDELESASVTFQPHHLPRSLNHKLDVQAHEKGIVPGNALIVLESLLPVLARAGAYSRLVVCGETYNPNTLTFDAFERSTLAAHRKQGLVAYPNLIKAGFGYGAKGEVALEVEPSGLQSVDWSKRGALLGGQAIIVTSELPENVGERGVAESERTFKSIGIAAECEAIEVHSREPGAFVTLIVSFEKGMASFPAIGARGVRIEQIVQRAFEPLQPWLSSDATVDPYLADQLMLPAALAEGKTSYKTSLITQRLITTAWVIKQFLPIHITILGREGEPGTITIDR